MRTDHFSTTRLFLIVMSVLILFCLTFDVSTAESTGSLVGRITDKETGVGIMSATILLYQDSTMTDIGTLTDLNGYFELMHIPPGKYNIEVTFAEYRRSLLPDVHVYCDSITTLNTQIVTKPFRDNSSNDSTSTKIGCINNDNSIKNSQLKFQVSDEAFEEVTLVFGGFNPEYGKVGGLFKYDKINAVSNIRDTILTFYPMKIGNKNYKLDKF